MATETQRRAAKRNVGTARSAAKAKRSIASMPKTTRTAPRKQGAVSSHVRPEDVAKAIPCGADVDEVVRAVGRFTGAGFTDVALVYIGGENQASFLRWAEDELLSALRD